MLKVHTLEYLQWSIRVEGVVIQMCNTRLLIFRTIGWSIAVFLQNPITPETGPLCCIVVVAGVPTCGIHHIVDQVIPVLKVGRIACGFPQASQPV